MKARALTGYGVLQVEPTDHCNLACAMCRPHAESWTQVHGVPKGFLSIDLWRRIVDTFIADQITFDHIIFQWLGDPLFHPDLHQILQEGQRLRGLVNYLRVDSNMILLDERRLNSILLSIQAGQIPVLMVASIDAYTETTYQAVKGYDRLAVVRTNIRRLLRLRRQLNVPVNLQVQFVVQHGNGHETLDFLAYWMDVLTCYGDEERWHDEIMFKRLSVDGGGPGQEEADRLYHRVVLDNGIQAGRQQGVTIAVWEDKPWQTTATDDASTQRKACSALWSTPVIRQDGRLMTCCADLQGTMTVGDLNTDRFSDLWLGEQMRQRRQAHLHGQFTEACAGCGGINWYSLPTHYADWV